MISVYGTRYDYAIMKQVERLKRAHPEMAIAGLDSTTNFSALAADETLYLVSHGDRSSGDVRGIARQDLLAWLTGKDRGVPPDFGGIVILSCYSGLEMVPQQGSLAAYLAAGLSGRVTAGKPVAGANGFSFGTPEFQKSGYSSVLPMDLDAFYEASDVNLMIKAWLKHIPAHTGGVLKADLGIDVDTGKTIRDQLAAVQQSQQKTPEEIAQEYASAFAKKAKEIEKTLADTIDKIPGYTIDERAEYLVTKGAEPYSIVWNDTILGQYKLFDDLYLWAKPANAFTVVNVS